MIPLPPVAILFALTLLAPAPAARISTVGPPPPPVERAVPAWAACPDWYWLAVDAGWPEDEMPTVMRVMRCESNCQPKAYNRSGATGLMQVLKSWAPNDDLFDPATNLTVAKHVHDRQGWHAWSCY
jgi:Transglycosylase SLT domain